MGQVRGFLRAIERRERGNRLHEALTARAAQFDRAGFASFVRLLEGSPDERTRT